MFICIWFEYRILVWTGNQFVTKFNDLLNVSREETFHRCGIWGWNFALNWYQIVIDNWRFCYCSTLAISTDVCWIINSFWKFYFNKWNILKYSLLSSRTFFDFEELIFENSKNAENNIISGELAKVLGCTPDWLVFKKNSFFNFAGVSGPLIIHKRTYPKLVTAGHRQK